MWELAANIMLWAWRKKNLRGYVINFSFVLTAFFFTYFYVNFKHDEALAEIRLTKISVTEHLTKINEDTSDTRKKVDWLYRYLLEKRVP